MIKISLIHPSRGRPEKAASTYAHWMDHAKCPELIEHILSLDFDDPRRHEYKRQDKITIDHNTCVVEATNQAAQISTGDILIYLSDDFKCPMDWDLEIRERININIAQLLKVHDGLQKFEADVLTIPIMTRQLYERLGYFFHPKYKSMWVDCDLYWVCKNNNWLTFAPDLLFQHEHYSNGMATKDATYQRSDANWNQGKEIYEKRKLEGFKL